MPTSPPPNRRPAVTGYRPAIDEIVREACEIHALRRERIITPIEAERRLTDLLDRNTHGWWLRLTAGLSPFRRTK